MAGDPNQQPIRRTVGRRAARYGQPLTPEGRAALDSMARARTRAPKGVFIYHSAEEMDRRPAALDGRRDRREAPLTQYTRPATWDDVKSLARYLDEQRVEYALVGGYALAAHGFNRFTEDIDILVNPSAENSRRWILALSRLPDAAAAELAAEGDVFANDKLLSLVFGRFLQALREQGHEYLERRDWSTARRCYAS